MKFLCDQMLARLGRWLRAAGYDTLIVERSLPDKQILEEAIKERRLLLTRDKHFQDFHDAPGVVIWLQANELEECVKEMGQKIDVNWLNNPFSRCLICNHELEMIDPSAFPQIPEDVRKRTQQFWYCKNCDKVFWEGSHTARMRQQLQAWIHKEKPQINTDK